MPCYVIARTRFREMTEFLRFRSRLQAMADEAHHKLLPLSEAQATPDDQSVMMEFDCAETARAFMCSAGYRQIATPEAPRPEA